MKEPLPSLTISLFEGYKNESQLACPTCGDDYVHLLDPIEHVKSDDYSANSKVRGAVIIIPGCCENGCRFNLLLGQHKGNTFVWAERRTTDLPGDPSDEDPIDPLDTTRNEG